jgi:hypothetical protein
MRTFSQAVDTEEDIEKYLKIRPAGQESNLGTLEWEAGFPLHNHDVQWYGTRYKIERSSLCLQMRFTCSMQDYDARFTQLRNRILEKCFNPVIPNDRELL